MNKSKIPLTLILTVASILLLSACRAPGSIPAQIQLKDLPTYRAKDVQYPAPQDLLWFNPDFHFGNIDVGFCRARNGDSFAAYQVVASGNVYVLKELFDASEDNNETFTGTTTGTYKELFGKEGFRISYAKGEETKIWYDYYYYIDNNGKPDLFVNTTSTEINDLNRDGTSELVSFDEDNQPSVFFWRDGKVNKADIAALVTNQYPDVQNITADNRVYEDAASGKAYLKISYTAGKKEEQRITAVYFEPDALTLRPVP